MSWSIIAICICSKFSGGLTQFLYLSIHHLGNFYSCNVAAIELNELSHLSLAHQMPLWAVMSVAAFSPQKSSAAFLGCHLLSLDEYWFKSNPSGSLYLATRWFCNSDQWELYCPSSMEALGVFVCDYSFLFLFILQFVYAQAIHAWSFSHAGTDHIVCS